MENESTRGWGMGLPEEKDRKEQTLEQKISYRKQNWQGYDDLLEEAKKEADRESNETDQMKQDQEMDMQTAEDWRNGFVVRADGTVIWARE